MRSTYFIIRILLIVLIMALIINFLLVFNPFFMRETAKEKERQQIEQRQPENRIDVPDKDEAEKTEYNLEENKEKDIIGYEKSEPSETETGNESTLQETPDKDDEYFLTYDEIVAVKDISFYDKLFGLSVLSKIDKEGMEKILRIADGGITNRELPALNSILTQYLSNKDIQKITELIANNKKLHEENTLAKK